MVHKLAQKRGLWRLHLRQNHLWNTETQERNLKIWLLWNPVPEINIFLPSVETWNIHTIWNHGKIHTKYPFLLSSSLSNLRSCLVLERELCYNLDMSSVWRQINIWNISVSTVSNSHYHQRQREEEVISINTAHILRVYTVGQDGVQNTYGHYHMWPNSKRYALHHRAWTHISMAYTHMLRVSSTADVLQHSTMSEHPGICLHCTHTHVTHITGRPDYTCPYMKLEIRARIQGG